MICALKVFFSNKIFERNLWAHEHSQLFVWICICAGSVCSRWWWWRSTTQCVYDEWVSFFVCLFFVFRFCFIVPSMDRFFLSICLLFSTLLSSSVLSVLVVLFRQFYRWRFTLFSYITSTFNIGFEIVLCESCVCVVFRFFFRSFFYFIHYFKFFNLLNVCEHVLWIVSFCLFQFFLNFDVKLKDKQEWIK